MEQLEFRAMGCQILTVIDKEGSSVTSVLHHVPGWFADWEQCLSRFNPDSELSRLNEDAGFWVPLSDTLWAVLLAAIQAARQSDGIVTPTLLDAVQAAGYTQDFALGAGHAPCPTPPAHIPDWTMINLDERHHAVRLPDGLHIDLGGIAKGWAADHAAQCLSAHGPTLVDAGGDIAVSGPMANGQPWTIGIANPLDPSSSLGLLLLSCGGVATSGRDYRRWKVGDTWNHHIIDPRTGQPAVTDVLTATAIAPSAQEAEMTAKLLVILGAEGLSKLDQWQGYAGMIFYEDGTQLTSSSWDHYIA